MSYVDTHCHLNFSPYHKDLEAVIARSFEAGVEKLINVGTDFPSSRESLNLAHRYGNIFATVGLHPHDARLFNDKLSLELENLARDSKVVAIGEIGLDYFRNLSTRDAQRTAFVGQLKLALKLKKPVVIHCRDAYGDVLEILDEVYLSEKNHPIGVIHSFSSSTNYLQEFLKREFYIGINGMVTYPNNQNLVAAVKLCPEDRLLIETDAPYLTPQVYRGKRNEPMHVIEVAKAVAEIKQCSLSETMHFTTNNAKALFGLE
ncbi:TatD family hydrolase [Patescibacteria group bacterium]|nr:TatD family hydrolase [Patescibacteria group bacterium]